MGFIYEKIVIWFNVFFVKLAEPIHARNVLNCTIELLYRSNSL